MGVYTHSMLAKPAEISPLTVMISKPVIDNKKRTAGHTMPQTVLKKILIVFST